MKKIISALLAAIMLLGMTTVFAQTNRAVLLCYDGGKLVYSKLLKTGEQDSIPSKYENTEKKVYVVDEEKFMTIEEYDAVSGATQTAAPEATEAPKATEKPSATPAPTKKPSSDNDLANTPYEKSKDKKLAPAMVVDVETTVDKNGDEVYLLNLLRHGEEISVEVDTDITISTVPDIYSALRGAKLDTLERGDMIYYGTDLSGNEIQSVNLIARAPEKDIVTEHLNYGTSFEQLINYADIAEYGTSVPTKGEYYAFGIVGKTNNNVLTLLNLTGDVDKALEITMSAKAYVYACDVKGKEYTVDITDTHGIETTLPKNSLDKGNITLDDSYTYDYALVRIVDGTATEIALYNNYND